MCSPTLLPACPKYGVPDISDLFRGRPFPLEAWLRALPVCPRLALAHPRLFPRFETLSLDFDSKRYERMFARWLALCPGVSWARPRGVLPVPASPAVTFFFIYFPPPECVFPRPGTPLSAPWALLVPRGALGATSVSWL